MFCPHCGAKSENSANFCINCGKQIVTSPTPAVIPQPTQPILDFQAQKNTVRQSEIQTLIHAIDYFSQKKARFDEYDHVCNKLNYYMRGAKSALLVWGCIFFTLGFFVVYISILADLLEELPWVLVLMLAGPGLLMIAGGILMKINNRRKYRYFQNAYARISQELYEHYANYPNCPVGPEYTNPTILVTLLEYLQSGRADTIKECINLAIGEAQQNQMAAYLSTIEQNTAAINAQTKVAAFFAAANFFK